MGSSDEIVYTSGAGRSMTWILSEVRFFFLLGPAPLEGLPLEGWTLISRARPHSSVRPLEKRRRPKGRTELAAGAVVSMTAILLRLISLYSISYVEILDSLKHTFCIYWLQYDGSLKQSSLEQAGILRLHFVDALTFTLVHF